MSLARASLDHPLVYSGATATVLFHRVQSCSLLVLCNHRYASFTRASPRNAIQPVAARFCAPLSFHLRSKLPPSRRSTRYPASVTLPPSILLNDCLYYGIYDTLITQKPATKNCVYDFLFLFQIRLINVVVPLRTKAVALSMPPRFPGQRRATPPAPVQSSLIRRGYPPGQRNRVSFRHKQICFLVVRGLSPIRISA